MNSAEEIIQALREEVARLRKILNTPLYDDFLEAVKAEGAHQQWYWGDEHDEQKTPQEWFWTLGWLAGKATQAHGVGDREKALHHTISSAALLMNWHRHVHASVAQLE